MIWKEIHGWGLKISRKFTDRRDRMVRGRAGQLSSLALSGAGSGSALLTGLRPGRYWNVEHLGDRGWL